jgi:cytochrome bd-type quinol oxidase subunit 1
MTLDLSRWQFAITTIFHFIFGGLKARRSPVST